MPLIKAQNVPSAIAPFSLASIEAQAVAILERARQKADRLLTAAQAEADQLRKQAVTEGRTDGKKQGLAEGMEMGKKSGHDQALNECRKNLTAVVTALS